MPDPTPDMHEEEVTQKPFDARLMWRLLGYLKPYSLWVTVAFVLILLTSGARQAGPYLSKIAVDDHILRGDLAGLNRIVLVFVGLLVFQFLADVAQRMVTQMVGQWVMYDIRKAIFAHLQRLPIRFFRPHARWPPDDPQHQRRGCAQRVVYGWGGGRVQRYLHADRDYGVYVLHGRFTGAVGLRDGARNV